MYRSMLYVPASSPRFVAKAASRGADAILLDLEDGVAASQKANARAALAAAVPQCAANGAAVFVRVNRPLRPCIADCEAVVRAGATGLVLPKTQSADHLRLIGEVLGDVEREVGRPHGATGIMAILEDPAAVLDARSIANADLRLIGLLAGGEDLATAMDAVPSAETLLAPKLMVHMAAKAAGLCSFGLIGTVADYADLDFVRNLAVVARRHGFDGATCIHPSVVSVLNEVFAPNEAELKEARDLIAAFEDAITRGDGAVSFRGRMIDEPIVERARRLLARA